LIGETENIAQQKENAFNKEWGNISSMIKSDIYYMVLKDIRVSNESLYRNLKKFFASVRLARITAGKNLRIIKSRIPICPLQDNCIADLETMKNEAYNLYKELLEAKDEEKLKLLEKEKQELFDRDVLSNHIEVIAVEINRLKEIDFLMRCISSADTRAITTLGNKIADDVITAQLRDRFLEEIIELVGSRFRIEMNRSGGKYGSPEYQISLLSAPKGDVSAILSEGEQTCVAIASFLAELTTTTHKSALVFDDPISSLDHKWRNRVTKRLIEEAKNRQIVIFTHDLIFVNDLKEYAKNNDIKLTSRYLDRNPNLTGIVNESLPWDGKGIVDKIDTLEKEANLLRKQRSNLADEEYKEKARVFYSRLRSAWERGLEEVALSSTIVRYRNYINPKKIKNISVFELDDCTDWEKNFKVCCEYTESHDASPARNLSLPEPDDLIKSVSALKSWVNTLKDKHKTV